MTDISVTLGDYKILFSNSYNIYDNRLRVEGVIKEWVFEFVFTKDPNASANKGNITVNGNVEEKKIIVEISNLYQTLGAGTDKPYILMTNTETGEEIFFSIYARALSPSQDFLNITLTFFSKRK